MRRKFAFYVAIVVLLSFFTNCGKKLQTSLITPESIQGLNNVTNLAMVSVAPMDEATGVDIATPISVQFNKQLNAGTISSASFFVHDNDGNTVDGTLSYIDRVVTFTPAAPLRHLTKYLATITSDVRDTTGNALETGITWRFTTVSNGTVPAPEFSPMPGAYIDSAVISISCSEPGASILYTTDGGDPTLTGVVYDGAPISIDHSMQIRAIAKKQGIIDSSITSADYYIQAGGPVFTPAAGTYNSDQNVTIATSTPGAAIYYTTDGSDPSESSLPYDGTPILIAGNGTAMTIKAIAIKTGLNNSVAAASTYTINWDTVADPTLDPPSGTFISTQTVTLTTTTVGATVRYTIDGSDPHTSGSAVVEAIPAAIQVTDTMTVRAYAEKDGMVDSNEITGYYIMAPVIEDITPNCGDVNDPAGTTLTITGNNFKPGATITLTKLGQPDIGPLTGTVTTSVISCSLPSLAGNALGLWSVVVQNSDGGTATLPDGFRIYELPTAGLLSVWSFNSSLVDSEPTNPHDGVLSSGSATYKLDRFSSSNKSISFAPSQYMQTDQVSDFPAGDASRTMTAWINISAFPASPNDYQFICGYGHFGSTNEAYALFVNNRTRKVEFHNTGLGANFDFNLYFSAKTVLESGRWYHVAVMNTGNDVTLYINGIAQGSASLAINTDASTIMFIGGQPAQGIYFAGLIDDVRVYGMALTPGEVYDISAERQWISQPLEVTASKGAFTDHVKIQWLAVKNANKYNVYRATDPAGPYTLITSSSIKDAFYVDNYPVAYPNTPFFYKVQARHGSNTGGLSNYTMGYVGSDMIAVAENFDAGIITTGWDFITIGATASVDTNAAYNSSPYGFLVAGGSTGAPGLYNYGIRFYKTFNPAISYFDLSLMMNRIGGSHSYIKVYVNNPTPADDTGYVEFTDKIQTSNVWMNKYCSHEGTINSIMILYFDEWAVTDVYTDDIILNYK